ncbi:MAG: ADP-ribosylglycohydrolase family protein [Clostridia bacterium]|nr:ADP-ribosylglycohydrolase family protein [Clostridia bacterium]
MELKNTIIKLRYGANMSQEEFAQLFKVSRQSVQKWESGASAPELSKLIEMSRFFGISLDALCLNRDLRDVEELEYDKDIKPQYSSIHYWEFYATRLNFEYIQCKDEGLDIEQYKDIFNSVASLPQNETKKKLGDVLFEVVKNAKRREDYKYIEPSELEGIRKRTKKVTSLSLKATKGCESKIHGAWLGRICGCMLGRTVEGIKSFDFIPFLKETNNYPLSRYICESDISEDTHKKYSYDFSIRKYADKIDGMPVDDDTNYTVLAQLIIDKHGRDFTPYDVSQNWLYYQSKNSYCTAERVAYCNFVNGFMPPQSASYQNPYREYIGAQIRADYFGYINPGNPSLAAEMAFRDASISHTKNGIYGEMLIAAMLSAAAVTDNFEEIILCGLSEIPHTSRLFEAVMSVLEDYRNGCTLKSVLDKVHSQYDETTGYGWCHVIPNAMIVVAALLYGNGDYSRSICIAVEACFDTDCNGATVGSIVGMAKGVDCIDDCWKKPINNTLHTSIRNIEKVKITDLVKKTMEHIEIK